MIRLNELFEIRYGNQFDHSKMEILSDGEDGIDFISRSSQNNGFIAKVAPFNNIEPFEPGFITVTLGGTYLLSSFVQPRPFYTAQNIKVLKPRINLSIEEKLYYCAAIEKNRFRYHSHGREANTTFDEIRVPSPQNIPRYVKKHSAELPFRKKPLILEKITLEQQPWKWFRYDQVFDIQKGFYNKKPDESSNKGDIPFIGATSENNGITSSYTIEEIEDASKTGDKNNVGLSEKIFPRNCITVSNNGSVGFAFYQPRDFTCTHDVNPLYLKDHELNVYIAMFLCAVIELEQFRWAYGRKWRPVRMPHSLIKLPVKPDGTPDWEFMENYIKSLPYSENL